MTKKKLEYSVYKRVDDIPEAAWNIDAYRSKTMTYAFWKTLENAKLKDIDYSYLVFFDDYKNPVGFAPGYTIRTDLAIFSSGLLKNILSKIRRLIPNFFTLNILECGSPITVNTPQFVKKEELDTSLFLGSLKAALTSLAVKKRSLLIVIRDFEQDENTSVFESILTKLGFSWLPALPNTYLDIQWDSIDDYHNSMRSHYRNKLFKHLRRNNEVRYEVISDFGHLSTTLCEQWLVIHNEAKELKREVLTPEFYSEISQNLEENSKVILFYQQEELIAHALLLQDNNMLRWLYVGRNKSEANSMYFFIVEKIIETAIQMKTSRLEMGLTTYPIKTDFGARIVPVNIGVRITIPLTNFLLKPIYSLLYNAKEYPKKRVFKKEN